MQKDLTPQQIAELRASAVIENAMPDLEDMLASMESSTKHKVFEAIRKGSLTPEQAMAHWMEMYSYYRLRAKMRDKASLAGTITETRRVTDGSQE